MGEENYRAVLDMVDAYKSFEKGMSEKVNAAQRTIMVFPGITKAYLTMEQAKAYLDEPMDSNDKLLRIVFKVAVDLQGNMRPMDAKKFLDEGDPAATGQFMADALLQRLMIEVQEYSIEGPDGSDVSPESILKKLETKGDIGKIEDIYKMTHIVHVRQLENDNNPNKATNILDYGKKEKWEALVKNQASKKIAGL